jgi:hypothetical protein
VYPARITDAVGLGLVVIVALLQRARRVPGHAT